MTKKEIELYIDTSSNERTVVALIIDDKRFEKVDEKKVVTSQILLPMIDALLMENKLNIHDITLVTVAKGPGSFTGLRVGITVANTLGWLLNIPVNGKHNIIVEPRYQG